MHYTSVLKACADIRTSRAKESDWQYLKGTLVNEFSRAETNVSRVNENYDLALKQLIIASINLHETENE